MEIKIIKEFDLEDVFLISEIIDKMGIDADIEKITKTIQTSKLESKKDAASLGKEVAIGLGIDIITKMVKCLYKAKTEVKQLIANMTGFKTEEINKLGIKQIKEFFTQLFQHEGLTDFLSQAGDSEEKI